MLRFVTTLPAAFIGYLLVIPVSLIIVPFWIFGAFINLIYWILTKRGALWGDIIQFKPEIGWQPRPNLNTRYFDRIGDSCRIVTDEEGWPGMNSIDESEIVVFGDSFAFGYGSDIDRAYFSMVNGYSIKPISAPGYNMVQELMLMRRYAQKLRGKIVVWFICLENDLADNLKPYNPKFYTNPYLRNNNGTDEWEIVTRHVDYNQWSYGDKGISNVTLYAHICAESEYSNRVFSAVQYLLKEGKDICKKNGAQLTVISIPYKTQLSKTGIKKLSKQLNGRGKIDPDYPDKKINGICHELDIPFIAGTSHLSLNDYKIRDGHWNFRGNRKVAQIIQDFYTKHHNSQQP